MKERRVRGRADGDKLMLVLLFVYFGRNSVNESHSTEITRAMTEMVQVYCVYVYDWKKYESKSTAFYMHIANLH